MKKTYQKPEANFVEFQIEEDVTSQDGSTGTTTDPGFNWT